MVTLLVTLLFVQSGWGPDIRLVYLPGGGDMPRTAAWGDTVHLVWYQVYPGHEEVFYKRSTDAGITWSDDILLSVEDNIQSIMPDVTVKGDTIIVAWNEFNQAMVAYRVSEDGGETFGTIDSIKGPGVGYPSIAMVADTVYMAIFCLASNPGVAYTHSEDGGVTWDSLRQLYNDIFQKPCIAVSWPNVHIIFSAPDTITGQTEIFYLSSSDGGRNWSSAQVKSHNDDIASQRPFITSWSGGVAVSWYDYKYSPYPWTGDIFLRRKNKFGHWSEIDSLTTVHRAVWSDILVERSHLHVVWEDDRHGFDVNFEIYYRESPDLGNTWFPEVRLTNAFYNSYVPSLACGGGYLHCFWRDARDNSPVTQIYYKRKDLSVSTPEEFCGEMPKFFTITPNPFRNETTISFFQPDPFGILEIFDEAGRRIFRREEIDKGKKEVIWETDKAGIYFVRFKTHKIAITEKVVALE